MTSVGRGSNAMASTIPRSLQNIFVNQSEKVLDHTMILPHEAYRFTGTGPKGTVSIIGWMGIGDNVIMIPALAELAKTKKVTLYTTQPELFNALDIRCVRINRDKGVCENGRVLDYLWDEQELLNCEILYKIDGDLIWRWPASFTEVSPQDRMCLAFGVSLTGNFDYVAALGAVKRPWKGMSIFAPKSTDARRSMPESVARTIYDALPFGYIRVGDGGWCAPSLQELIDMIYTAERVISVDTGIAHIAAALGVPLEVIGAFSDAKGYYSHYARPVKVQQLPCNRGTCKCKRTTEGECMNAEVEILTNLEI